jgi:GNAT superfamily N-acetyltransferase
VISQVSFIYSAYIGCMTSENSRRNNGSRIRALWPTDLPKFRNHLKRLDAGARHARFGHMVNDNFIDAYVDTAWRMGTAIFGAFIDGEIRGSAELRLLPGTLPLSAEGAIAVERTWQNQGIGQRLMARLVEAARNRGPINLYMICLRDNARMRHIANKSGAKLAFEAGEISGNLAPRLPSPASLAGEVLQNTQDFVTAMLEWPLRAK